MWSNIIIPFLSEIIRKYKTRYPPYNFDVILAAQTQEKRAYIEYTDQSGLPSDIYDSYKILGYGNIVTNAFLKSVWSKDITMEDFGELCYFIIKYFYKNEIDCAYVIIYDSSSRSHEILPFYSMLNKYQLMKFFLFRYGNREDNYTSRDRKCLFSAIILSSSVFVLLILSIGFLIQSPVLAQMSSAKNDILNDNNGNNFVSSFRQVVTNIGQPPMITNISSNGNYKVQLSFNTPISIQSLPKNGFSPSITFLNATAPPATSNTIPNRAAQAGVTTVGGSGTQYNVPGSIQRLASVSSFDMTIYDNHGKVLWNKANQPVTGGKNSQLEQVVFPDGYTGNITILIHNIKPGLII